MDRLRASAAISVLVTALCAGGPGMAIASDALPAPVRVTLQAAAPLGQETLTRTAAETAAAYPQHAGAIALEALALSMERQVREAPSRVEDILADALFAADLRGLIPDRETLLRLRQRAEQAARNPRNAQSFEQGQQRMLAAAEIGARYNPISRDGQAGPAGSEPAPPQQASDQGSLPLPNRSRQPPASGPQGSGGGGSSGLLPWSLTGAAAGAAIGIGGAVGSGGGGGGDGAIGPINDPTRFETDEYFAGGGLAQINASTAYGRGLSGSGQIIAVADSGVDSDHPDLADRIEPGGRDFFDDDSDANPSGFGPFRSHGTHVAGIAAASRNETGAHGVAYRATILPIRIGDASGVIDGNLIDDAINLAVAEGSEIFNASFASAPGIEFELPQDLIDAIQAGVDADMVFVFATGNDSNPEPSGDVLIPNIYPQFADNLIGVAAVDSSGSIATFSNRCGAAAEWCLVAPGVGITSTIDLEDTGFADNDGYGVLSGTSMATPHVSGAVAILKQLFPNLSGAEIVDIVLDTASDLGAPGTDSIYGRGLLDLKAATAPQGAQSIALGPDPDGDSAPLEGSGVRFSPAFGDAGDGHHDRTLAFLDGYGRAYAIGLSSRFTESPPAALEARDLLGFGAAASETRETHPAGHLSLAYRIGFSDDPASAARAVADGRMMLHTGDRQQLIAALDAPPGRLIGLTAGDAARTSIDDQLLQNPYLALIADQGGDVAALALTDGELTHATILGNRSLAGLSILTRAVGGTTLALHGGLLIERGAMLGAEGYGAFAMPGATTGFAGVQAITQLWPGWRLLASAFGGGGRLDQGSTSLVTGADSWSSAGSLALEADGLWRLDDRLLLSLSQPLRVESGQLGLLLPVQMTAEDRLIQQQTGIDLAPTGRELRLGATYALPLGPTRLAAGLMGRLQPGHRAEADPEALALIRLSGAL